MTNLDKATPAQADNDRFNNAVKGAAARREAERKAPPRERKKDMGGMRLKLSVNGSVEGYHLYWENDEDGAIETLLYSGFDFVSQSEVSMESAIVQDSDLGDRVSRYVGKRSDGSPLRAYLLKCPDEVWAERENNRYEQADARDADIRSGNAQRGEGRYKPKGIETSIDTQFRK